MPRKRTDLLDFLDSVSYKILRKLKDGEKTFTELYEVSGLSKRNFDRRLGELIHLGIIIEVFSQTETGRKKKKYALTPIGKRILELLEEIERVYKEGVSEEERFEKEAEEFLRPDKE